jgi:hypothetical protein
VPQPTAASIALSIRQHVPFDPPTHYSSIQVPQARSRT